MLVREVLSKYVEHKTAHHPLDPPFQHKLHQISLYFGDLDAESEGKIFSGRAATVGWGPGTLLRMLCQVRAVLNFGVRCGLISKPPVIPLPHVYDVRFVQSTIAEIDRMLDFLMIYHPEEYPFILMLSCTGARLGELCELNRGSFTTRGIEIKKPVARRSKTVSRFIPVAKRIKDSRAEVDAALDQLEQLRQRHADKPNPNRFVANVLAQRLADALKDACESLKMPRLRVHDLRHAFAAMVGEKGGELADIATLLGHTNINTSLRYRGLVQNRAATLVQNMM